MPMFRRSVSALVFLPALVVSVSGQAVRNNDSVTSSEPVAHVSTAGASSRSAVPDDDVVVLSPFEVTASKNVGYLATESLAGTRIRTDLRDVGSAISVATKEFMDDLGATDSETLLQFMTGMEVGGSQGNFLIGTAVGDGSTIDDTAARVKPQSNTRTRGLDSADNTRDFFLTDIPWDGYNTGRIDIQRGANSILFGNGSGAGIINGSPDPAIIGKNSTTVNTKFASYGSMRLSINLNQTLIPKQLAIRVAGLQSHKGYQQDPAYNNDKRYYVAVRFDPKFLNKGGSRTSIRANYEYGEIDANRPRLNTINDAISPWFIPEGNPIQLRSPTSLGRPDGMDQTLLGTMYPMISHDGYDPFVTGISTASLITGNRSRRDIGAREARGTVDQSDPTNPDKFPNPNAEAWLGALVKNTDQGGSALSPSIDGGGLPFWMGVYADPNSSNMSYYMYPSVNTYYAVNTAGAIDSSGIAGLRGPDYTGMLRLDSYASRGIGSFLYALQGLWRSQTISDTSVFDYYNKLLDGPNKSEKSKFHAFNASIDQTFFRDLVGFQLSFDQQSYSDYARSLLSNPTLRIDIYKYLPVAIMNPSTGLMEPVENPNFGRPYVISKASAQRSKTTREVGRFTPYVNLNFRKMLGTNMLTQVLGKHTITGLYEMAQVESTSSRWTPITLDQAQSDAIFGPNRTINDSYRSIGTINYIGPSLLNAASLSGANLAAITANHNPVNGPAWYFDSHYINTARPNASFTVLPLGLYPNQLATGSGASTQNENPGSYAAWGTSPRLIRVSNDTYVSERDLTYRYQQVKNKTTSMALVDQWKLLDDYIVITAGIRKDKAETFYPGDPSVSATDPSRTGNRVIQNGTTGAVDWNAPFDYIGEPTYSYTSKWMKTYGGVFHIPSQWTKYVLPFGLQASVYANYSENFRPENRNDPISGSTLTPPTGKTKELGVSFATLSKKFSVRINWFDTSVKNATLPNNGVIGFMADEVAQGIKFANTVRFVQDVNNGTNISGGNPNGIYTNNPGSSGVSGSFMYRAATQTSGGTTLDTSRWYPWQPSRAPTAANPWTLQDWVDAEQHAIASTNAFFASLESPEALAMMSYWQIKPGNWDYHLSNFGINPVTPMGAQVTGDTESRGTEIELFFSPVKNWDLTVNVAKVYATRLNLAGNVGNWLQNRWALYNEAYDGAEGGLLVGAIRWYSSGQGSVNSGNARFGRNGYRYYSEFYAKEGTQAPEIRPWRFNIITKYSFRSGFMKGLSVGANFRWEDRSVIGYGVTETTPELSIITATGIQSATAAVGRLDISKPFYSQREQHVGLWASYERKLGKKVGWKIQFNLSNVGENTRLIPITMNPDGSAAAYRIASGMTWELSNTFTF